MHVLFAALLVVVAMVTADEHAVLDSNSTTTGRRGRDVCAYPVFTPGINTGLTSLVADFSHLMDEATNSYDIKYYLYADKPDGFTVLNPCDPTYYIGIGRSCGGNPGRGFVCRKEASYPQTDWAVRSKPAEGVLELPASLSDGDAFSLMFTDGSSECGGTNGRRVKIVYVCDRSATAAISYVGEFRVDGYCQFEYRWRSKYACLLSDAKATTTCTFSGGGQGDNYDLTPLARKVFIAPNTLFPGINEYITICDSIVYITACGADSVVCEYNSMTGSFSSVATSPTVLYRVAGKGPTGTPSTTLSMAFTKAKSGGSAAYVVIDFVCDVSVDDGAPAFHSSL